MELGFGEILVVAVIVLLLFGPSKLPQLGDALGKGIRNFKKASMGEEPTPPESQPHTPRLPDAAPERPDAGPEREPEGKKTEKA
jgi:sec-independent protein translocase protein TatA